MKILWRVLALWSVTLVAWVFAPAIALFADGDGWLPKFLFWAQTQDADLDTGWRIGLFGGIKPPYTAPSHLGRWWYRTRWLWRNPAYGMSYYVLGIPWKKEEWAYVAGRPLVNGAPVYFKAGRRGDKWESVLDEERLFLKKRGYKTWWYYDFSKPLDFTKPLFTDGYAPLYPHMPKTVRVPFAFGP
jgi:hypothetical protein